MTRRSQAENPDFEEANQAFLEIIDDLKTSAHSGAVLARLRELFKILVTKTSGREAFLRDKLVQPPLDWHDLDVSARPAEPYPFLQGDIIETRLVDGLAGRSDHQLWMVLSVDCDAVRADFVRVARVLAVEQGSTGNEAQLLSFALKIGNHKLFPLPPIPDDDEAIIRGYVADLEVPYFLNCREVDRNMPRQLASLTEAGWHILNALLFERVTRTDLVEAQKIRSAGIG